MHHEQARMVPVVANRHVRATAYRSAQIRQHRRCNGKRVGLGVAAASLRHIAHLGVTTRRFSYINRGLQPPGPDVRVELVAPDGTTWEWGDNDAIDRVTGPALDFCLVVTQRRHRADTALHIEGDRARQWMSIAQAFAGPPTDSRPEGGSP